MEYNHKINLSLVEKAKADGRKVKTTTISIDEIQRMPTKQGHVVITLVGRDKRKFSAFERIWELQNIPMGHIDEGDEMEIDYVENGDFKNFLKVTLTKDTSGDNLPF